MNHVFCRQSVALGDFYLASLIQGIVGSIILDSATPKDECRGKEKRPVRGIFRCLILLRATRAHEAQS